MSHVDKIVDDLLSQIKLAITIKQKAYIGVFTAPHNLTPVFDAFIERLNNHYGVNLLNFHGAQLFLKASGVRVDIWQKPAPFADKNHLTLTVGGFTAIIFDYEN